MSKYIHKELKLPGKKKPYLMAHRGNSIVCPENTRAAFMRAQEDGADLIETDVHLSADEEFICIHDPTVDRTTDGSGAVAEMSVAELKKLSASYGRPEFADERILTLKETMALFTPERVLALELKTDRFLEREVCERLIAQVDAAGMRERFVAISFSVARVQAVQAVAPDVPIGLITVKRLTPHADVQFSGPLWPILLLNPFYMRAAHRRGQLVCALDTAPEKRHWLYYARHCDVIMSNDPGVARKMMQQRPTWE